MGLKFLGSGRAWAFDIRAWAVNGLTILLTGNFSELSALAQKSGAYCIIR